jgi:hypothetical protein
MRAEILRLRRAHWGWLPWWLRLAMVNSAGRGAWAVIGRRAIRKATAIRQQGFSALRTVVANS